MTADAIHDASEAWIQILSKYSNQQAISIEVAEWLLALALTVQICLRQVSATAEKGLNPKAAAIGFRQHVVTLGYTSFRPDRGNKFDWKQVMRTLWSDLSHEFGCIERNYATTVGLSPACMVKETGDSHGPIESPPAKQSKERVYAIFEGKEVHHGLRQSEVEDFRRQGEAGKYQIYIDNSDRVFTNVLQDTRFIQARKTITLQALSHILKHVSQTIAFRSIYTKGFGFPLMEGEGTSESTSYVNNFLFKFNKRLANHERGTHNEVALWFQLRGSATVHIWEKLRSLLIILEGS